MRCLLVHGGAVWATHDVHTGLLAGLRVGGHEVIEYALGGRLGESDRRLKALRRWHRRHQTPLAHLRPTAADIQYDAGKDVLERALHHEVDWVVVVCAAYLHPNVLILCRRAGLRLAAVFTESPYDDAQQAKVAPLFDVCFTNERTSLPRLREANPNTHYLRVGYDPAAHAPDRNGYAPYHDVVFVGSAFESRVAFLSAVDWAGIDLQLFGLWPDLPASHPLRPFVRHGVVDNHQAGEIYRHARIGLNLYRAAGPDQHPQSLNPRAYELAADGVFTLSQPRAEVAERFGPSVPTFSTPQELQTLLRHFLRHDSAREEAAARLPPLVSEDTYHHRAAELVARLAS